MNTFVNVPTYPPVDYKVVVRPNFDTLYSVAWLDLTKDAQVVSAPTRTGGITFCRCSTCGRTSSRRPAGGRPAPGRRISSSPRPAGAGGKSRRGSRGSRPHAVRWVIGRTKTDGAADYPAVHKIQAGYKVTPLSRSGQGSRAGDGDD